MINKKLHVLLVSDMGKVGGTEIATYITAKELKSYVQDVYVLGKKGPLSESINQLDIKQFDVISHTKNPIKILQYILKVIYVVNK